MGNRTCPLVTTFILIVVLAVITIGVLEVLSTYKQEIPDRYSIYAVIVIVAVLLILISWFFIWLICPTPSKIERNVEAATIPIELTRNASVYIPIQPPAPSQPQASTQSPTPPKQQIPARTVIDIKADASQNGAGAYCTLPKGNPDLLYVNWEGDDRSLMYETTDVLEFAAILHAIKRWAPHFQGCHFKIHSDRRDAIDLLNSDKHTDKGVLLNMKQKIDKILDDNDIISEGIWIPREYNTIADMLSHLSDDGMMDRLKAKIGSNLSRKKFLVSYMSKEAATYVPMSGN